MRQAGARGAGRPATARSSYVLLRIPGCAGVRAVGPRASPGAALDGGGGGGAAAAAAGGAPSPEFVLCVGDDRSDEEMFTCIEAMRASPRMLTSEVRAPLHGCRERGQGPGGPWRVRGTGRSLPTARLPSKGGARWAGVPQPACLCVRARAPRSASHAGVRRDGGPEAQPRALLPQRPPGGAHAAGAPLWHHAAAHGPRALRRFVFWGEAGGHAASNAPLASRLPLAPCFCFSAALLCNGAPACGPFTASSPPRDRHL